MEDNVRHELFEWHGRKAAANFKKHGVRFENAMKVLGDLFADRFHIEEFDVAHSTDHEERWITTGSDPGRRSVVLVISWTKRKDEIGRTITRIINARPASRNERIIYGQQTN